MIIKILIWSLFIFGLLLLLLGSRIIDGSYVMFSTITWVSTTSVNITNYAYDIPVNLSTVQDVNIDFNTSVIESINKNISAIYYINLDYRIDRKQEFLLNFNLEDISHRILRVNATKSNIGAVGCLKSHITALQLALSDNLGENLLICEDDLSIGDMNYCNKMLDLFFRSNLQWDVLMLGQSTWASEDTGITTSNQEKIIKVKMSQTTSGYLVKRSYIPLLLQTWEIGWNNFTATGIWNDKYSTDQLWKPLQLQDNWYSFVPTVASQRLSYSDIEHKVYAAGQQG